MEQRKSAFVFPARVINFKNLGEAFLKSYPEMEDLFDEADLYFNEELSPLFLTESENIAIPDSKVFLSTHVMNCLLFSLLQIHNLKPEALLGSSLGIYASLFASGSISFKESNTLIKTAIESIKKNSIDKKAFTEISGLSANELSSIIEDSSPKESVFISHFNSPNQFTISGYEQYVRKIAKLVMASGGISSSIIFIDHLIHTGSLKLSPLLKETIVTTDFKVPEIPICSDTDVKLLSSGEEIRITLSDQITKPVLFEKAVRLLIAEGINSFIEIGGEGKLSRFIRWIDRKIRTYCIQDKSSFDYHLKLFGKAKD